MRKGKSECYKLSKIATTAFASGRLIAVAAAIIAANTIAASAATLLSDNTFGDITATATYSTNGTTITPFAQCTSCGNPGEGLEAQVTYNGSTNGNSYLGVIDNFLSYDPSTNGAISTIAAAYDRELTLNYTPTGSVDYVLRALIEQDSKFYVADITLPITPYPFSGTSGSPDTDGWVNLSTSGLTASDFALVDFSNGTLDASTHPNFAGDTILFGIAANIGIGQLGRVIADYDNLSIAITPTPLPASLPLFMSGAGLIGLLLTLRRTSKLA
jgi:hypothetical protein